MCGISDDDRVVNLDTQPKPVSDEENSHAESERVLPKVSTCPTVNDNSTHVHVCAVLK